MAKARGGRRHEPGEFRRLLERAGLYGSSYGVQETAALVLGLSASGVGHYLFLDRPLPEPLRRLLTLLAWDRATTPRGRPLPTLEGLLRLAERDGLLTPADLADERLFFDSLRGQHPASGHVAPPAPPEITPAEVERVLASCLTLERQSLGGGPWEWRLTDPPTGRTAARGRSLTDADAQAAARRAVELGAIDPSEVPRGAQPPPARERPRPSPQPAEEGRLLGLSLSIDRAETGDRWAWRLVDPGTGEEVAGGKARSRAVAGARAVRVAARGGLPAP